MCFYLDGVIHRIPLLIDAISRESEHVVFKYDKRSYGFGNVSPLDLVARYFYEISFCRPNIVLRMFLNTYLDRILIYLT